MTQNFKPEAAEAVAVVSPLQISTRTCLSINFIQSAAFFSRESHRLELCSDPDKMTPDERNRLWTEHNAVVVGAIISATAFLEAAINELFAESGDEFQEHLGELPEEDRKLISRMWNQGIPRTAKFTIVQKYEVFLSLLNRAEFDRSVEEYDRIQSLIRLRNALIHYEPEWQTHDASRSQADLHNLERHLRSRFAINPFTGGGNPFYPDKCLGHGAAEWAVESSVVFFDLFVSLTGISSPIDHVRQYLKTTFGA